MSRVWDRSRASRRSAKAMKPQCGRSATQPRPRLSSSRGPDRVALIEAARTSSELRTQGMTNQQLVINGLFRTADPQDPLAVAIERRGAEALAQMPPVLSGLSSVGNPSAWSEHCRVGGAARSFSPSTAESLPAEATVTLPQGLMDLARAGRRPRHHDHGLVMVMGKGAWVRRRSPQPSRLRLPIAGRPST